MRTSCAALVATLALAGGAQAEFSRISDQATFTALVANKTLVRPMFRLQVSPEGRITGTGMARDVAGTWSWQDGFFCRDLIWGSRNLGYNCQEVAVTNGRIRFTSDRGAGDSADFRLRSD